MARPKKDNADYFSHDADMRNDLKIKALRNKFGVEGYAVWNMLLEVLTDSTYFEYEWNEVSIELMAADFGIESIRLEEILFYSIKLKLLNHDLTTNVIYSQKLKDRFSGLLSKRERSRIVVMAVDNPETQSLMLPINPQSKEKKSKEKKSIIEKNWKTDFSIYLDELNNAIQEISNDAKWIAEQEELNPNVDIVATIKKGVAVYWGVEAEGYANKKKSRGNDLNWKSTFAKNMNKNIVWKSRGYNKPISDIPFAENSFAKNSGLVPKIKPTEI